MFLSCKWLYMLPRLKWQDEEVCKHHEASPEARVPRRSKVHNRTSLQDTELHHLPQSYRHSFHADVKHMFWARLPSNFCSGLKSPQHSSHQPRCHSWRKHCRLLHRRRRSCCCPSSRGYGDQSCSWLARTAWSLANSFGFPHWRAKLAKPKGVPYLSLNFFRAQTRKHWNWMLLHGSGMEGNFMRTLWWKIHRDKSCCTDYRIPTEFKPPMGRFKCAVVCRCRRLCIA